MTFLQDARAQDAPGATWVDQPTQPELQQFVADAFGTNTSPQSFWIYAWNETAEGGPGIVQTAQEGTRYTDALKWGRGLPHPNLYTYELSLQSLVMSNSGTWTLVQPASFGIQGAHDSDEISSSNTGDFKSLTHARMTKCELMASTGTDRGIVEADVDGSFVANVDLYSASPAVHQAVWSSGTLSDASHTCKFLVTGTKNASSSSVKVQIDSVRVTYHPHVGAANDNAIGVLYALPPARERRRRRRQRLAA